MLLLHIGAFRLDVDSHQRAPWQSLAPRTRLLCALLMVFAIALTPNGRWWTWAIYGLGLIGMILSSRITLPVLLRRVAMESVFVSVLLLSTLFREGGDVIWQWGWLQITTEGLEVLGSVTLKALLSLLTLNLLILTTSVPALLHALVSLRTPKLLVAILESMYRYIAVILEEVSCMRRAATSRNFSGNGRWQRQVLGNMIGILFIRSFQRGERVYQAMKSRGYQGLPPIRELPKGGRRDVLALTLVAVLTLLGQSVYLL
ncbi:cobalt ECF transporter T component CbiQ [Leptolyngbya sp. FACHB-261]|uniref:cobalt ECF transporter T component CbiQ n=1 Tax=Leptolyngbya sp. FACHB-261 TaxID=2692806 RepID=UPI0016891945|nr:cobalt ECF transporter T component CbiQ [Leptolyngbya sp. FACHB-261]MBD2099417.1 cobalt ECF transporter T component CbiQ [Leptolyngbya sp. FACHB-261]